MKKMIVFTSLLFSLPTHASYEVVEIKPISDLSPPKQLVVLKSNGEDCMPKFGINLNMPINELLNKYPTDSMLGSINMNGSLEPKSNLDDIFIIFYGISENVFWDWVTVIIDDNKVNALIFSYMNTELFIKNSNIIDMKKAVENVKPLFNQLCKLLGNNFEKKITYSEKTSERSAMYVWKRKNDVIAFTHSPISKFTIGNQFDCELIITKNIDDLNKIDDKIATDSLPEDALLWVDAMGDEANTDETNRVQTLVYVWIALVICFIPILYFTRKIILKK